jgi:hypothetical protein
MNHQLHSDITSRLERDYGFKPSGTWLTKGKCPSCDKKEMFTSAEHPWVLRCGRANKCGVEFHVKEIYSDLFESWGDRYKATPAAPNAAADAYLRDARGFDLAKIAGWYKQESYYDPEKKLGSATVRFPLTGDAWWERIIDRPDRFGDRKATFRGKYAGTWWQPPFALIGEIPAELWIVEGIFDAIAWLHHDVAAVAAMSCNNYPGTSLTELAAGCEANGVARPKLVWGLDGDRAGRRYARQWVKKSREQGWEATAAVIAFEGKAKLDWNDMHQRGRLEKKDVEDYRYQGALLLAESAPEKARLMYSRHGWQSFSFEFDNKLWWFKLDLEKMNKSSTELENQFPDLDKNEIRDKALLEAGLVTEIANCYPTALYYQANLLTDESWYYFRIDFPHDGPSVNNTFTGGQLASASEFKKRLLGIAAGAVFTGNAHQLDAMLKRWLARIKTVETIDYIGYSRDHGAWVFNDVAVKAGKLVPLNDEDFFDIGRLSIKSLNRSVDLAINADLKEFSTEWVSLLWQCYHHKGIAALAFWLGSLFAEQIRQKHKSYPFIELVGEPGAGKSTLIEFLWRLAGRSDYEGFDPSKSTMAARARNFSQVSGLPVVLIEGDRTEEDRNKQKGFDWDELKPLYNGRSVYSRGVKNSGNETYEPPFRGALTISQNAPVAASDAIMQRILHISFDLASHTPESKVAADALGQIGVDALSGFALKATLAEKAVLGTFEERVPVHEKALLKVAGVRNLRIVKNHAQLAALVDALVHVVPLGAAERAATHAFIEDMAGERQEAINADHQVVQEFWDIYDFLNGDGEVQLLNHSRNNTEIAINLNHFVGVAADRRQQIPELRDLKKLLKTSRVRKYIDTKGVNSAINDRYNKAKPHPDSIDRAATVKCWVFQAATRNT